MWREDQSPRVKKEKKRTLKGKWESIFSGSHMDNVRKETHVVSVMIHLPLETVTAVRDEKDDRPLPHQIRRPRLTTREKNFQKHQMIEMKTLQTKEAKIRADTKL